MDINGSYIDDTEILEYWRMSSAYEVKQYKRLLWTAELYSNRYGVSRFRAYKAIDALVSLNGA